MLPTFVIGLREGVEASLIVGIVAAFLRQQGRRDALRWMWAGVIAAVLLCAATAVGLQILDRELPQREQEELETVVAAVAVLMVTFMIVWMRRHARALGGDLRTSAASALARASVTTVQRYLYIRLDKGKCFASAARNSQLLVLSELEGQPPDSLRVERQHATAYSSLDGLGIF